MEEGQLYDNCIMLKVIQKNMKKYRNQNLDKLISDNNNQIFHEHFLWKR